MFSLDGGPFWLEQKLILVSYLGELPSSVHLYFHKGPCQPLLELSSAALRARVNESPRMADGSCG